MAGGIVLGCFEVPGWGGLATATYRLFETMLADGIDVDFVSLVRQEDRARFRALLGDDCENPRGLPRVHTRRLHVPLHEPHPGVAALLEELAPRAMVGLGDIAAYLLKRAAPAVPMALLTGGCMQVNTAVPFTEQSFSGIPATPDWKEREAVALADLILAHSGVIHDLYRRLYPRDAHRIHPRVVGFAEWIHAEAREHAGGARPFGERDVDALFVASDWSREEKAFGLVAEIAARLPDLSVHVAGEASAPAPGAVHHGLLKRGEIFELMGRSRTVVCPSSFDAAPGVLFEGSAMGCNVVASRNCGNWDLCHEELVAEPYTAEAFAGRIRRARERPYADSIKRYLAAGSYRELTRVLADPVSWPSRDEPPAASRVRLSPALPGVVPEQRL